MNAYQVIVAPILSEKSTDLKKMHTYVFRVHPKANKYQIVDAVKELYNVEVLRCRTLNVKGKPKRLRREAGYTSRWKKAYITLAKGASIATLDGV